MAEGKKIEIKIAATGGDQAAAEIGKVQAASAAAEKITGFGGQLDGVPERADEVKKSFEEIRDAAEKAHAETAGMAEELEKTTNDAAKGSSELDEEVGKIAKVQKAQAVAELAGHIGVIGSKFKEAAAGVEQFDPILAESLRNTGDKLERVGSGATSLALGFAVGGPLGAGLAGIGVLIGEMANAWVQAGVAASAMDQKTSTALDSMTDRMSKVANAKAKLELGQWIKNLASEEAGIKAQNEALGRNRDLLEAVAAAKMSLAEANANQEIAKINADPLLSDAEKIKKTAAVKESLERSKLADKVNGEDRDVRASEEDAMEKIREAERLAADAAKIAKRKAQTDAALKEAERIERARASAEAALPKAQQELGQEDLKALIQVSNPLRSKKEKSEILAAANAARLNVENLQNLASSDPRNKVETERLRQLKADTDSEDLNAKAAAKEAAVEAEKQRLDAAAKRAKFEINKKSAVDNYVVDRSTRKISTDAEISELDEKEAAEEKRKKDAKQKKKEMQEDAAEKKRDSEMSAAGKNAVTLIPKNARERARKAVEAAAAKLGDGDQGGEVEALLKLVEQMGGYVQKVQGKASASAIKIEQLAERLRRLEGK